MDVPVYRRAGFVPSPPSASTRHRLPLPVCFVVRCLLSKQRCLSLQRQWMDLTRASLLYSSPNRVAKDGGSCLLIFLLRLSLSKNIDSGSHVESLDRFRESVDYQRKNGYGNILNLRVHMKFLCAIRFVSFVEIVRVLTIIEWLAVNINNCLL